MPRGVSCRGAKEHMPLKNKIRRGKYAPSKYNPDEIRNCMFLLLMKKALMGGIGGRRQNLSLRSYDKLSPPPLLCAMPRGRRFLGELENYLRAHRA